MSEAQLTGWPFAIEKAARAAIPAGATPAAVVAVLLAQAKEFLWADQFRPAASDDPIRADLIKVTRLFIKELATLADKLESRHHRGRCRAPDVYHGPGARLDRDAPGHLAGPAPGGVRPVSDEWRERLGEQE